MSPLMTSRSHTTMVLSGVDSKNRSRNAALCARCSVCIKSNAYNTFILRISELVRLSSVTMLYDV